MKRFRRHRKTLLPLLNTVLFLTSSSKDQGLVLNMNSWRVRLHEWNILHVFIQSIGSLVFRVVSWMGELLEVKSSQLWNSFRVKRHYSAVKFSKNWGKNCILCQGLNLCPTLLQRQVSFVQLYGCHISISYSWSFDVLFFQVMFLFCLCVTVI
jgi:hypothetical protein